MEGTTLSGLRGAYLQAPALTRPWAPPAPRPLTFVSTITSILDIAKGLARTSVPTRGRRYWQQVTDTDLLMPPDLDAPAALGCVVIVALLALAVFK